MVKTISTSWWDRLKNGCTLCGSAKCVVCNRSDGNLLGVTVSSMGFGGNDALYYHTSCLRQVVNNTHLYNDDIIFDVNTVLGSLDELDNTEAEEARRNHCEKMGKKLGLKSESESNTPILLLPSSKEQPDEK